MCINIDSWLLLFRFEFRGIPWHMLHHCLPGSVDLFQGSTNYRSNRNLFLPFNNSRPSNLHKLINCDPDLSTIFKGRLMFCVMNFGLYCWREQFNHLDRAGLELTTNGQDELMQRGFCRIVVWTTSEGDKCETRSRIHDRRLLL